jgi:hypothetical protein
VVLSPYEDGENCQGAEQDADCEQIFLQHGVNFDRELAAFSSRKRALRFGFGVVAVVCRHTPPRRWEA